MSFFITLYRNAYLILSNTPQILHYMSEGRRTASQQNPADHMVLNVVDPRAKSKSKMKLQWRSQTCLSIIWFSGE
jgi:hypothetical protein